MTLRATIAMLIVACTMLLSVGVASAGMVVSGGGQNAFGHAIATVRLDFRHDYTFVGGAFVPLKSGDEMCQDANNPIDEYEYTTAISGVYQKANGRYYIDCSN